MMTRNRVTARSSALAVAVAMAGTMLGLAGCTAAAANPGNPGQLGESVTGLEAQVTGYTSSSLTEGPSGPVSVVLRDGPAARLDQLVNGLRANTGPGCHENARLYQIDFTGAQGGFDVTGYQCGGLVSVTTVSATTVSATTDGKIVTRIDRNCTLLSAVRRLLPASATATQRLNAPCVNVKGS
jgi:hypothetical protein